MASELRLREDDELLIRACQRANDDPDVKLIEQQWHEIRDEIQEPWSQEI